MDVSYFAGGFSKGRAPLSTGRPVLTFLNSVLIPEGTNGLLLFIILSDRLLA
jgi:hypothetical protein